MPWNDDSWKDGYDAWKLASPDDDYDEPCDHEDYEIDIIAGRAECHRCGESWYASEDEILSAIDAESAYDRYWERENRREWWREVWRSIRAFFRIRRPVITDDDVPF